MKGFLHAIIILIVLASSGISFPQHTGGSGGGGTRPYNGPSIPTNEEGGPCYVEDDKYCNYSLATLRDFEKILLPLLENKQAHCLSFPVKYNSIVEFYNHVMIQVLVGKLKAEEKKVRCGDSITGAGEGFRSCFLDENLKTWLEHFLYYPKSLSRYLQSEHGLNADQAKELINGLMVIKGK